MSTTQTLSNIATGLRAVDCELAAMRSLNGTLVSALTTLTEGGWYSTKRRHSTLLRLGQHDRTVRGGGNMKAIKPTSTMNNSRKALLCMGKTRAEVRGLRDVRS